MKNLRVLMFVFLLFLFSVILFSNENPYTETEKDINISEDMRSDSLNMRFIGSWPFGPSKSIAFDTLRNLAFCTSGGAVCIFDMSDPSCPVIISDRIRSRYKKGKIFYESYTQRLYIYVSIKGIVEIWDVSDPLIPEKIGFIKISLRNIFVSGPFAYIVNGGGLSILDITDPSNPQLVGFCDSGGASIAVAGSYAYIIGGNPNGFRIVDVSDPSNPQQIGQCWQEGHDIEVVGSYAYLASGDNLPFRIVDISDPYNPEFAGYYITQGGVNHIHVKDTLAYLSTDISMVILNVSDTANVVEVSSIEGNTTDLFLFEPYVYVLGENFRVIDVSTPSNPQMISSYQMKHISKDVMVMASYAYIASGKRGLQIVDISDPYNPEEMGYCDTPGNSQKVSVSGHYAYVADCDSGLRVIDISDPANPEEVGFYDSLRIEDVFVSGLYAYATGDGFYVFDVSDPSNPLKVGEFGDSYFDNLFVSGHYAYVSEPYYTRILDISDPSNPDIVSSIWLEMWHRSDIYVDGMYLYAITSDSYWNLAIVDISDPLNPEIITEWLGDVYWCSNIHVEGRFAYISSEYGGVDVVDVTDLYNPQIVGYYKEMSSHSWYSSPFVSNSVIYMAYGEIGLQIYEFLGTGVEEEKEIVEYTKLRLAQNPVKGNYIEFYLNSVKSTSGKYNLYNLLGQRVRAVLLNNLTLGENKISLPCTDIPAGVYFLKVETEENVWSEKLVIVK